MHEIDFLPEEYRKNNTRRRQQSWKVLLLGAIVPLILASFLVQQQRRTKLQAALSAVEGDRLMAVAHPMETSPR